MTVRTRRLMKCSFRRKLDESFTSVAEAALFHICVIVALTLGQTQGGGGETSEGARFEASEGHGLRRLLNFPQIPFSASCFSTIYCNDGIHISFHVNLHRKSLFFGNINPWCFTFMLKQVYCIWVWQPLSI